MDIGHPLLCCFCSFHFTVSLSHHEIVHRMSSSSCKAVLAGCAVLYCTVLYCTVPEELPPAVLLHGVPVHLAGDDLAEAVPRQQEPAARHQHRHLQHNNTTLDTAH